MIHNHEIVHNLTPIERSLLSSNRLQLTPLSRVIDFLFVSFLSMLLSACSHAPATPFFDSPMPNQEQAEQLQEANALLNQAQTLFDQGLYVEALPPAKAALAIRERILGPTHLDIASAFTTLGLVDHQRTELAQAKQLLEQALAIRQSTLGPTDPKVGNRSYDQRAGSPILCSPLCLNTLYGDWRWTIFSMLGSGRQ